MPSSSQFNIEYAVVSSGTNRGEPKKINLSKQAESILTKILGEPEPLGRLKILNNDLSIMLDQGPKREPFGFITRGDYSQARGHGVGLGVIPNKDSAGRLKELMDGVNGTKSNGVIALFRNTTSARYHPCWVFRARN